MNPPSESEISTPLAQQLIEQQKPSKDREEFNKTTTDEKLINSSSKQTMKIFIEADLGTITQETFFQKALEDCWAC